MGKLPLWKGDTRQSLNDQARLVEAGMPDGTETVHLVGHSFGGLVAMKVAARLKPRATKLVLLEANPFYLLAQAGRTDAFAEAWAMRDCIKEFGALGEWPKAAEKFADYFGAAGSWAEMLPERQAAFAEAIKPNFFEWDCMDETTSMAEWAQLLPRETLVVTDPNTILPIREITALMREACPLWSYKEVAGGHMAPLTRPDLVNPLIVSFLRSGA